MSKDINKTHSSKLNTTNSNHITYRYEELSFEIIGGINQETFQSFRIMLLVKYQRAIIREQLDLYNNLVLTAFIRKVAEQTGFSIKYVETALNALINELETHKLDLIENVKQSNKPSYQISQEDEQEAMELLKKENLLEVINKLIGETGIIGEEKNRLILFLTYLSRKTNAPIHSIIQSQHNYLQSKVGALLPDEDKIELSHLSDNCLFYYDEDDLLNKVLLIQDTDSKNRKRLLPLFDLQTKGYFTKTTIQKNEYGQLRTYQKQVNGQGVVLSISTKEDQSFQSNEVHNFSLTEQQGINNEAIMAYQRKQSAGLVDVYKEQKAVELIQNIQRCIQPIRVINPMAVGLVLPKEILNPTFTNSHYLKFIQVVTLLHQYQREKKVDERTGEEYIETSIEDIEKANELLSEILVAKCDSLNKQTRAYFEKLKVYLSSKDKDLKVFTTHEIHLKLGIPKTTIKRYNSVLVANGFVNCSDEKLASYVLTGKNEYQDLQDTVLKSLNETLKSIQVGGPSTQVDQKAIGLPKLLNDSLKSEVAQNGNGVPPLPEPKTKKRTTSVVHNLKKISA